MISLISAMLYNLIIRFFFFCFVSGLFLWCCCVPDWSGSCCDAYHTLGMIWCSWNIFSYLSNRCELPANGVRDAHDSDIEPTIWLTITSTMFNRCGCWIVNHYHQFIMRMLLIKIFVILLSLRAVLVGRRKTTTRGVVGLDFLKYMLYSSHKYC